MKAANLITNKGTIALMMMMMMNCRAGLPSSGVLAERSGSIFTSCSFFMSCLNSKRLREIHVLNKYFFWRGI